jgi:DNA-binding XRE family transcriptional regulator/predicted RNase H-like HicB family nuclease
VRCSGGRTIRTASNCRPLTPWMVAVGIDGLRGVRHRTFPCAHDCQHWDCLEAKGLAVPDQAGVLREVSPQPRAPRPGLTTQPLSCNKRLVHSGKQIHSALQFVAYARRSSKDGRWHIRFPDIDDCTTSAKDEGHVPERARAALEECLHHQLDAGERPSWPEMHLAPRPGEKRFHITVPASLAIAVQIRRLRAENGWSQSELARRVGVSQQQIAKVEDPDANPTVDTITKVAKAFDQPLVVVFGVEPIYSNGV